MTIIRTSLGDITIKLYTDKAPLTCENFLKYCKENFYKDTIFHRVIKGFMIQGGGLYSSLKAKPSLYSPIKNEANNGLKNKKYTISMARTSAPHSATTQFFINTNDNDFLNFTEESLQGWGYCVFGEVIKGKEIVDKIENEKTCKIGPYSDVPRETITILEIIISK
ncbi:MAG: peptidylprolyl isomerase [Succinivibrionaceae bacterium]